MLLVAASIQLELPKTVQRATRRMSMISAAVADTQEVTAHYTCDPGAIRLRDELVILPWPPTPYFSCVSIALACCTFVMPQHIDI